METLETIRSIASRSRATLAQDALGAVALMVILFGSLHLPALV